MACDYNIELLFKLWKSQGRVDESRSTKPWRILCEVYAKLLAMLVQHWVFLVSFLDLPRPQPDQSGADGAETRAAPGERVSERPAPGEGALDGQALPRGGVAE